MLEFLKAKKLLLIGTSVLLLLVLFALVIVLQKGTKKVITPTAPKQVQKVNSPKTLRGFNLSPKSFSNSDFTDFLEKIKGSTALTWAGDWNELGNKNSAAFTISKLGKKYGFEPIVIVNVFNQGNGKLIRPLNSDNLSNYKKVVVTYAQELKPKYLGLGLEINLLYEKDPTNFETFVQLFKDSYLSIKSVSKETKVFTTFQLERMKGLHGGLFGGINSNSNNQWALLDKFPDSDLNGLTTYPSLIYKSPNNLSSDYYTDISTKTSKKLAFVETGWPANSKIAGWESDEAEQALFVDKFFELTRNTNKEVEIWPFIYDPPVTEPFSTLGLVNSDGSERLSYKNWLEGK